MFRENQKIGLYTLIRKLGRGGFGEVWLAEKRSQLFTKSVAIKLPLDEQVNLDAISQEAKLWEAASGHPNVLPIIDADIYDGQVAIVSEYAEGGTLASRLSALGKFLTDQAVEIVIGVLSGLDFLHSKRIIHRDIKPQNILLQGDTPRLADFGISRAMQTTAISSTISGTDAYLAPESFKGKRNVQTDVWSVGVVFYQLLKGKLPFPQEHPSERMYAILVEDFASLPDEIPDEVKRIIAKALSKNPDERYLTANEMRNELQRFSISEAVSGSGVIKQVNSFNSPTELTKEIETVLRQPETETIVQQPKVFKSITAVNNDLSGVVWKMGTNWGGRDNPNFYHYIKDNQIILTIDRFRYSVGDLVLVTNGFTVKAIVKIIEQPQPLESNPEYKPLFDHYKVIREHAPLYAKADWYELKPYEVFQYKVQRGGSKVNQPDIKRIAFDLWKNRNIDSSEKVSEFRLKAPQSNFDFTQNPTKRWEREETGISTDSAIRHKGESETYWNTRNLTYSVLGKYYRTPQENMRLLTEYLNDMLPRNNQIIDFKFMAPTNENLRFYTNWRTISFNAHDPIDKEYFLRMFSL